MGHVRARCIGGANDALKSGYMLLRDGVARVQRVDHFRAVHLLMSRDDGVHNGNAHASTYVAQQVVETARIANLLICKRTHGGGGKRNENHAGSEAAQDDCPDKGPLGDEEIYLSEAETAQSK